MEPKPKEEAVNMSTRPTEEAPEEALSLRVFFHEAKAEMPPPASLVERIMADAALHLPTQAQTSAPPREPASAVSERPSWWELLNHWWSAWMATTALVATACVVLLMQPSTQTNKAVTTAGSSQHQQPLRRHPLLSGAVGKGLVELTLWHSRKTTQGHTHKNVTHTNASLKQGDLVQLQYRTNETVHLMMVSLNNKGEVSRFIPFAQAKSLQVAKGKGFLPPTSSLELDEYVGVELFFLIASKKPFSYTEVKRRIERERKRYSKWYQIRTLPGPWQAQVLRIRKLSK